MSITLDPSVNALVAQAQAMSQAEVATTAAVKSFKGALKSQEALVTTLFQSAAGLSTYNAQGAPQVVPARGAGFSGEA